MIWCPVPESVDVRFEILRIQLLRFQSLNQEIRQMDSLGSRRNFYPVVDEIERLTRFAIRVGHSIEGLQFHWPVDHEKCVLPDHTCKLPLLCLREIHSILDLFPALLQHINRLRVLNLCKR